MTDKSTVPGKRTEGTLLTEPVQRITPKSDYLRALEASQQRILPRGRYNAIVEGADYTGNVLNLRVRVVK